MKKIIGAFISIAVLSSCGQADIKNPISSITQKTNAPIENSLDALLQNQVSLIKKSENLLNYKEKGTIDGKIKLDINSQGNTVKGNLDYNFKFNSKKEASSGNIKAKFDANIKDDMKMKIDGDLDIELATFKKKIFFKLNSLNLNTTKENPILSMIKPQIEKFKGKWLFSEIPENPNMNLNKDEFTKNKDIVTKILKKYPILKSVKENKNKEYYDYDITLNKENIIKIITELRNEIEQKDKKEFTKKEITKLEKNIDELKLNGNIKINKKDTTLFILTITTTNIDFKLENTEKTFNFKINKKLEKTIFSFNGNKNGDKISGKFITEINNKEIFSGNLSIEKKGDNYIIDFNGKSEKNDSFNININNTIKESNIKIEEPKGAQNIEEAMKSMQPGI